MSQLETGAVESLPPIDMEAVKKRCGGDATFATAVTDRFRAQAGNDVGKIRDALDKGDADSVKRLAHSLKSMAAFVSADTATQLARKIEELGAARQLADITQLVTQLGDEITRVTDWLAENANSSKPLWNGAPARS